MVLCTEYLELYLKIYIQLLLLNLRILWDSCKVVEEDTCNVIKCNVTNKNTPISPPIRIVTIDCC